MSARNLIALAISLAVLGAAVAHAQLELPRRPTQLRFEGGVARAHADASDLADAALQRRLSSGLPQTLVTRVYAYVGDATAPVAVGVRSCRVTYDPWGLTYRVQVQTESTDRTETLRSVHEVVDACIDLRGLQVGRARDWQAARGARVWLATIIELNPLSPDTVHRIRRWLTRPDGGGVDGEAFFGSFVSLFVNRRIGEAERTLRFRSDGEVQVP